MAKVGGISIPSSLDRQGKSKSMSRKRPWKAFFFRKKWQPASHFPSEGVNGRGGLFGVSCTSSGGVWTLEAVFDTLREHL